MLNITRKALHIVNYIKFLELYESYIATPIVI